MFQPAKIIPVRRIHHLVLLVATTVVAACGTAARLPLTAGIGPNPALPPPSTSLIPLVNVVSAKGWPANAMPVAAEGTAVTAFAKGLERRSSYAPIDRLPGMQSVRSARRS